jgi:hypothetical protein
VGGLATDASPPLNVQQDPGMAKSHQSAFVQGYTGRQESTLAAPFFNAMLAGVISMLCPPFLSSPTAAQPTVAGRSLRSQTARHRHTGRGVIQLDPLLGDRDRDGVLRAVRPIQHRRLMPAGVAASQPEPRDH